MNPAAVGRAAGVAEGRTPGRGGDQTSGWAGNRPAHPGRPAPGPPRSRWRRSRPDRGAASLWLLAAGLVLVFAGMAGAAVGAATLARHRAQVAADLGALAGARHAVDGGPVACPAARRVAAANGGRLAACQLEGLDLTVTVEVPVSLPALGSGPVAGTARATARAGPVRSPPDPIAAVGASAAPAPAARSASSTSSSTRTAPALASGSLPLPHLGDWTHEGQPASQSQVSMASRVAPSQSAATA